MTRFTSAAAQSPKLAVWGGLLVVIVAAGLVVLWVASSGPSSPQEQIVLKAGQLLKDGTETMRQITERGSATLHREAFRANVGQVIQVIDELAKTKAPTDASEVKALKRHQTDLELAAERFGKEFERLYQLPDFMAIMHETLASYGGALQQALQQQRERPGLLALFPAVSPIRIPGP